MDREILKKRFTLFLIGCIGARSLLVYYAKTTNKFNLRIMAYGGIIIAFSFLYLYFSGIRKTGFEVFGDKIWWDKLRPIHAIFYILFAYNVFNNNNYAWIYLAIDVLFGLLAFLYFHYINGNLQILLQNQ